jgi:predicted MPP superfamily phosphohydrolase
MRVRRPFLNPLWLLLSLPGYVGWRLLPALTAGPWGLYAGIAVLIGACVLLPRSVRIQPRPGDWLATALIWTGLFAMGFFSSLFVLTLLRDVFLLGLRVFVVAGPDESLTQDSAAWVVAGGLASSLIGLVLARRPRIVAVDVPIANLPEILQGFTIAQITDLHVGPTIRRGFVRQVVARVNALSAEVIVVTGDLVDGSVAQLKSHTAPLAGLAAPQGVYFVTGNHEYYSGEAEWTAEIRRLGLRVLKNEHVVIHRERAKIVLAGVTDWSAHHFDPLQRSDPQASLRGAPADADVKILLAHQPSSAAGAAAAGFDLQISGHTHGGQFMPWNFLVRFFQPFTVGLHRRESLMVYVSRGTGYWGPPNRFGVGAEITRLRLVAAGDRPKSPAPTARASAIPASDPKAPGLSNP